MVDALDKREFSSLLSETRMFLGTLKSPELEFELDNAFLLSLGGVSLLSFGLLSSLSFPILPSLGGAVSAIYIITGIKVSPDEYSSLFNIKLEL